MAIQIIDNFELGAAKPIDNRFVVGPGQFYTDKNTIPHKYTGLRVWDLTGGSPGIGYVWDGSSWQTEASSSIAGSGTSNQVPKFIAPGNVVTDSIITDNGARVGISWTTLGTSPYNSHKLVVNGSIMSISGGFYGSGANITTINASNISSGFLSLSRLTNSPTGKVLISGGSQPEWTDRVQINTAPSSSSTIGEENSIYFRNFSATRIYSYHNPGDLSELFIDVGGSIMKVSSSYFDFNRQVRLLDGSQVSPSLSFTNNTNTGIYRSTTDTINISTAGVSRLSISPSYVSSTLPFRAANGSGSEPSYSFTSSSNTGMWFNTTGSFILERHLRFSVSGSEFLRFTSALLGTKIATFEVDYIRSQDGFSGLPVYSFESDTNTGIYRVSNDVLGISALNGLKINSSSQIRKVYAGEIYMTTNSGLSAATSWNDYSFNPDAWFSYSASGGFNSPAGSQAYVTLAHSGAFTDPSKVVWNVSISYEAAPFNGNHTNKITNAVGSGASATTIYLGYAPGWNTLGVSGIAIKFTAIEFM